MNLKDILHGLITRTAFGSEAEREAFHAAVDNLDLATGEESPEATQTDNQTDGTTGTESTVTPPADTTTANQGGDTTTPTTPPDSSAVSESGSGAVSETTSNGPGA